MQGDTQPFCDRLGREGVGAPLQQERSKSFTLGGICLDDENGFWLSGQWTPRVPHRFRKKVPSLPDRGDIASFVV
jgi:hypothetical protein